jgi:hypothetical protein
MFGGKTYGPPTQHPHPLRPVGVGDFRPDRGLVEDGRG